MKRTLALLVGLMLCISLIPAASVAEEPAYSYSMVMYNFGPLDEDPIMVKHWEEKYGVDFDLIYAETSSLRDQVNLMIAGGEIPDVMQHIDSAAYFDQGILGGWTEEFFREKAPRLSAYIDEIEPAAWSYAKFDGELMYSIPGFRLYNTVTSPIIWRTDWLENVGISEIPKTIDDVEAAFYKFVNDDP
ncbi:MAG TPA: extracellular solute-binding protein, partial [Clostridia bacterium]|nr:extracellular solute-binding protein [Clostridia bacterium]